MVWLLTGLDPDNWIGMALPFREFPVTVAAVGGSTEIVRFTVARPLVNWVPELVLVTVNWKLSEPEKPLLGV